MTASKTLVAGREHQRRGLLSGNVWAVEVPLEGGHQPGEVARLSGALLTPTLGLLTLGRLCWTSAHERAYCWRQRACGPICARCLASLHLRRS